MIPLIALLLTLSAEPSPPPQPAADAAKLLQDANALFEKNENDKALEVYERVVKMDPKNVDARLGRARTLARLRKYDEAIAGFGEALRLRPNDALALRDRGHYFINVRRLEPALADLVKAESLNKDDYGIYYHLALARYITGDFKGAEVAYEGCLRTAPSPENRIACYGWQVPTLMRSGRQQDAQKALDAALALGVKSDTAYLDRLMLFKGTVAEDELANTMAKGALQLATVGYSIGVWHLVHGRADKARAYFTKATASEATYAFGYVAAEAELKKMK